MGKDRTGMGTVAVEEDYMQQAWKKGEEMRPCEASQRHAHGDPSRVMEEEEEEEEEGEGRLTGGPGVRERERVARWLGHGEKVGREKKRNGLEKKGLRPKRRKGI